MSALPEPKTIAKEFARILRSWATDGEWKTMLEENAAEDSASICHSHDFCDANMAMDEAFRNLGVDPQKIWGDDWASNEDAAKLWNDAWSIAKREYLGGGK